MKLKTRLIVAFVTIIALPIALTIMVIFGFGQYQINAIEETYGITGTTYKNLSNSIQVFNQLTEDDFKTLSQLADEGSDKFSDAAFLDDFNSGLKDKNSFLLVRKDDAIVFAGAGMENIKVIEAELPEYEDDDSASENGVYLGGKVQVLVKQIDFKYTSGKKGSAFIVTDVSDVIPEVRQFVSDVAIAVILILIFTAMLLIWWIQRGILGPLGKMRVAAQNIKEGNLNFRMDFETEDELGQLCRDFEEMRLRLRDNAEEKLAYDKANKELISNISHDLKTPITSIKGYVEGIIDGVADTPEKVDKYIRTIYNKANEMDLLINELTLYSKIDTNKIPYNFSTLSVNAYFNDCAEDLSLELESKNVMFSYSNKVEGNPKIIADPEQLKRVIHNIVNNSVKYMDKVPGRIMLRVVDVGDFIQVELEDNGKGIANKDLANIFERFYRTDASRNSSKGGSGIGLSIVKKIVEEHGGKIWATSKEGLGTVMYFVIRKYQEVPVNE
ncbi:MAG: HAMP domain-containing sensor histidine kinase [Lachnospiraceae bacterium]|nr:HAMP domain-containing sensor histidine kinase [Lachnospiraceae bacterium]